MVQNRPKLVRTAEDVRKYTSETSNLFPAATATAAICAAAVAAAAVPPLLHAKIKKFLYFVVTLRNFSKVTQQILLMDRSTLNSAKEVFKALLTLLNYLNFE